MVYRKIFVEAGLAFGLPTKKWTGKEVMLSPDLVSSGYSTEISRVIDSPGMSAFYAGYSDTQYI